MAKLSKIQIKNHEESIRLLNLSERSHGQDLFILENYHELSEGNTSKAAYFTPIDLAEEVAKSLCLEDEGEGVSILDACSGVGVLAFFIHLYYPKAHITCVELDKKYYDIGRRILPTLDWCNEDILEHNDVYDYIVSNPPFISRKPIDASLKYRGARLEYQIVEHLSRLSIDNTIEAYRFILPSSTVGYRYSGQSYHEYLEPSSLYKKFINESGLYFHCAWPVDTQTLGRFKSTNITVEIASIEQRNKDQQ